MALSFVLSQMELGVTTIAMIFASMTQSPLAAVFIASMYLPFVNKYVRVRFLDIKSILK